MPPPPSKNITCCYNPSCLHYNKANEKAPLKCGRCRTAHYCDKKCQRAHWSAHKEFCEVWAETAKKNGEIPIVKIKKKMTQLIWLIRGAADYTSAVLKEYVSWKREGGRGCVEFDFDSFEELFEAIRVLETLPVIDEHPFYPMPFAPTYHETETGKPIAQKLPIRIITPKEEEEFMRAVGDKMDFMEPTKEYRPNMVNCMDLLGDSEQIFILCVTVKLQGTYSTHMFDFIYKRISWYPEDGPKLSPNHR